MIVECIKERLKEAIYLAERSTGKNLALPILGTVLLEAKGQELQVRATNLDIGLELSVPAKVEREGVVAVNAHVLSNFLGNLFREDKVTLKLENDNISVSTTNSSTLLKSFGAEDFPTIPRVDDSSEFRLSTQDFVAGLRAVAYSAAISEIKPEIASVYIYQEGDDLVYVATDSFRLAEKKTGFTASDQEFMPVIIPVKNITEITRVFDNKSGEIVLRSNKNQISCFTDNTHLTSRLIDGIYPDYRQIMPAKQSLEVLMDKAELIQALKLTNIFADRFHQVVVKITPADKSVTISAHNQDIGENQVTIAASVQGELKEPLEVSFNARYILDSFQAINGDRISLRFTEKNRPLLISGVGDKTFRYLVMPINR
jgi:DNA polymerase III subunit beta